MDTPCEHQNRVQKAEQESCVKKERLWDGAEQRARARDVQPAPAEGREIHGPRTVPPPSVAVRLSSLATEARELAYSPRMSTACLYAVA